MHAIRHLMCPHDSDRNEEELGRREIVDIIQSTSELIIIQHGSTVNARVNAPYSEALHAIFLKLSTDIIHAKLGQRSRNLRRPATKTNAEKNPSNEVTVENNDTPTDYDVIVKSFNITQS